jgi:release factor glutamine methyltransferase
LRILPLVRILDVINKTATFFAKHGIENPRLNIELLLAHLLRKKRLELYLEFERELDPTTLDRLREMVRRRAAGEPLQYIAGETEFCGLTLAVDRRVLIPRPETELLVETAVQRLAAAAAANASPATIVDLCTGSGCIAVALAKRLTAPGAETSVTIYATDASREALEVARANANRHQVEKNIRFLHGNLLDALPVDLKADAIISNPPYVASGELAALPREVRDFEPLEALRAGQDGLEAIRPIIAGARRFLQPAGFVALELGAAQRAAVEHLFGRHGCQVVQVVCDLQGHERVMVAQLSS